MSTNPVQQALENRNNFPTEERWKYIDEWVAWSPDFTRIVAASADMAELEAKVTAAGLRMDETVVELIQDPDIAFMGGAW